MVWHVNKDLLVIIVIPLLHECDFLNSANETIKLSVPSIVASESISIIESKNYEDENHFVNFTGTTFA